MTDTDRFAAFNTELAKYKQGVHRVGPGATADEIRLVEAMLSRSLPAPYREFLARYNGLSLFHDMTVLYGTPREQIPGTDLLEANLRRWPGEPAEWIIIGSQAWGDEIGLVTGSGASQAEVAIWDHERGRVAKTLPLIEGWLNDAMVTGSHAFHYDGSHKRILLELARSAMRSLMGKRTNT